MLSHSGHNLRFRLVLVIAAALILSLLAVPLVQAAPHLDEIGSLIIACDTGNVEPGEIVGCHITIDGVLQPDIIPGQPATFTLMAGTHAVHIDLIGEAASLWDPLSADYSPMVYAGATQTLRAVFNKKALLTVTLNKPGVVGDLYLDGVPVGQQVGSVQVRVSSYHWHKVEAKNLSDPSAQGVYRWKDSSSSVYLYPAQDRKLSLSLFKQYLMGFLRLRCVVYYVQSTDDVACNVSIDGNQSGAFAPGAYSQFNLPPGSHSVTVTLSGVSAGSWEVSKTLTVYTSAGVTSFATAYFKKVSAGSPSSPPPVVPTPSAPPVPYTGTFSGFGAHARQIFLRGRALGRIPNRFDKVGDSDTDNPAYLTRFDDGFYDLGDYDYLDPMITYFDGSFVHIGQSAHSGFVVSSVLNPMWSDPKVCKSGETPLACEYRIYNPSIAIIMLRTYPVPWGDAQRDQYRADMRTVVETTINQGIVPVLSTVPMIMQSPGELGEMNDIVRQLAAEYDIPLWDMFATTANMPGYAVDYHNHLTIAPDGVSTYIDTYHLQYGMTHRNLETLEMLHLLYNSIMQ